jgi:hypothetical protein
MSYKTPWRSLGDSNPCFRRERAIGEPAKGDGTGQLGALRLADHQFARDRMQYCLTEVLAEGVGFAQSRAA